MKKTRNDYRGQSKKLEAKNKTKAKAFAKKDAGRKSQGAQKSATAETEESRYVQARTSGSYNFV